MGLKSAAFISLTTALLQLLVMAEAFSKPTLSAKELLETTNLKEHVAQLQNGDIVMMQRPETEKDNELNVIMAVMVPKPLDVTVATLQRQSTAKDAPGLLAAGKITASELSQLGKDFAGARFADEEYGEVTKMMKIVPDDEFNFSLVEIDLIKQKAKMVKDKDRKNSEIEAMSEAMREILMGRYLSYRKSGLEGLAPYQFGPSKQVSPAEELANASQSLHLVKERFPDFYSGLLDFPGDKALQLTHQFYWAKQAESKRPLFLLKHWMMDIQPDYALVAERRYYLNHSLSSLQVVIGCFPYDDHTLVLLISQTFTEKVNMPVGRRIAKKFGYDEVEKNIKPMFEALRKELGR